MTEETLRSFLDRALVITSRYESQEGRWSYNDQIARTHSEVSQVFQAVKHGEGRARELEEIADAVLGALTMSNVWEFTNEELIEQLEKTLKKIEERTEK